MSGLAPYRLVLLRHGQSEWNAAQRFTGWANPALSTAGEGEARRAGALLAGHAELDIPTGIPLAYQLGPDMRPAAAAARYLDPGAASRLA